MPAAAGLGSIYHVIIKIASIAEIGYDRRDKHASDPA